MKISNCISFFVLIHLWPLLSIGQKGNDNNQKILTGLDFDCSEVPCGYNISGTFNSDITTLKNDNGVLYSGYDFQVIDGYKPNPENPVAYVSSQPGEPNLISVYVEFETNCETLPTMVGIRGVNTEGYHFPAMEVDVYTGQGTGSYFTYTGVSSSNKNTPINNPLPINTVDMFDLDVVWQICKLGPSYWGDEDNWETMGMSINRVYVTCKAPKAEDPYTSYSHMLTLFHIGCVNAEGLTQSEGIISSIWEYFKDAKVKKENGDDLSFYNPWEPHALGSSGLISTKNGQCTAWSKIFLDAIKILGVQEQGQVLYLDTSDGLTSGILVNDWVFNVQPSGLLATNPDALPLINQGFDYLSVPHPSLYYPNLFNSVYTYTYTEVADDLSGQGGQNSGNPASDFFFHEVSEIDGKIYDPSYGFHVPYLDNNGAFLSFYEDDNIAGYWRDATLSNINENTFGADLNGNGDMETSVTVLFKFIKKYQPGLNGLNIFSRSNY